MSDRGERPLSTLLGGRYVLRRRVGAGSFGEVFEAMDTTRERRVALKRLKLADATSLYAFKQEFRALADLTHPNLVALHDLFVDGGEWYFSMEFVDGVDFLRRSRPLSPSTSAALLAATLETDVTLPEVPGELSPRRGAAMVGTLPPTPRGLAIDEPALRATLGQLAAAVHALHRAGRLHRDLKPSNVLVTAEGRVVVVDFGLVALLGTGAGQASFGDGGDGMVGTPGYMAPEQASARSGSRPPGPPADWYAVGVMLHLALTGVMPFTGDLHEVLLRKQIEDGPDPRRLVQGAPADLCELAVALMACDPARRPDGAEVLRRLHVEPVGAGSPRAPLASAEPPPFVGRAEPLRLLADALVESRRGHGVIACVHGPSGMGKSSLVRHFLDGLVERGEALVLDGRCYERESVPYKALDSLLDRLTAYLRRLPTGEAEALMPRDVRALARVFPVLLRSTAVERIPEREARDPAEHRRRAAQALRELLARIGDRRPLVLWIDDVQWSDLDSATLLGELLAPPEAPALLLLASYRSDESLDEGGRETLSALRADRAAPGTGVRQLYDIPLAPLSVDESRELARRLLDRVDGDEAAVIARESQGSPLFVQELARARERGRGRTGALSLDEVLAERIASLPDQTRRLLSAIAVAGQPIPFAVVAEAAGIEGGDDRAIATLRAAWLVRTRGEQVECFHDRVREVAAGGLREVDRRATHLRLGTALEARDSTDAEALARHFQAAGLGGRAAVHAERAAVRAEEKLAFDRAALLWEVALSGAPDERRGELRVRLADALANAGYAPRAARAYLAALEGQPEDERSRLRIRAAEQFLRSGYIDEGMREMGLILRGLGIDPPGSPLATIGSLLLHRTRLLLRGLDFKEKGEREVSVADRTRIDACWSLGNGLGGVDTLRGADFQARHLLLALRAGEPYRISRALSWEAIFATMEGRPAQWARAQDLIARSRAIAHRLQHPHAIAWASAAEAIDAWTNGRWREAADVSARSIEEFRRACRDIAWEVGSMQVWWLGRSLVFLGALDEVARLAPACIAEAERLGDLYTATSMRTFVRPFVTLAGGDAPGTHRDVDEAIARWSPNGWHLQHWTASMSHAYAHLYAGEGERALERMTAAWPRIEKLLLLRLHTSRVLSHSARARSALGAACSSKGTRRAEAIRQAERDARALLNERKPWPEAYALLTRAGIAHLRGDDAGALSLLLQAEERHTALEMRVNAAAARRQRGRLVGGDEGRALVSSADATLGAVGIREPERFAAIFAPGFDG